MFFRFFWAFLYCIQCSFLIFIRLASLFNKQLGELYILRSDFENRRTKDEEILSNRFKYHVFHVSSEGEFSQIFPLMDQLVQKSYPVLLLYTSPSLEKRANNYKAKCGDNFYLRPIIFTVSDFEFLFRVPLHSLTMCRYDFLPWLMILGNKAAQFNLLNATSIRWRRMGEVARFFRSCFYSQFNLISTSSRIDEKVFKDLVLYNEIININLRVLEVEKRQNDFLNSSFYLNSSILFESIKQNKNSICIGSSWLPELKIFRNSRLIQYINSYNPFVFIFPHSFHPKILNGMYAEIAQSNLQLLIVEKYSDFDLVKPGIICVVLIKGLLCELYPFFTNVIVGGGFGVGVHSVLEPMCGSCHTIVGPNVGKSTEVEDYRERFSNLINICQTPNEVADKLLINISEEMLNVSCESTNFKSLPIHKKDKLTESFNYLVRKYEIK